MVAAWIGAAYWFTASTSFANPAITIARSLTNTFAGSVPPMRPLYPGAIGRSTRRAGGGTRALPGKAATGAVSDPQSAVEQTSKKEAEAPMSESVPVTIYHNPACGTSRNTLGADP